MLAQDCGHRHQALTQGRCACKVGQLRAERARYEKALRRELGEDVPLARALDEASDWRGRAQQISLLQERLLSLQESQASLASLACDAALPSESRQRRHIQQRVIFSGQERAGEVLLVQVTIQVSHSTYAMHCT